MSTTHCIRVVVMKEDKKNHRQVQRLLDIIQSTKIFGI